MSNTEFVERVQRVAKHAKWEDFVVWSGGAQIALQFSKAPTREEWAYLKRWCEFEMQQLDGEAKISSLVRVVDGASDGSVGQKDDTIKPSSVDAELAASPRDQPSVVSGSLKALELPVLDGVDDSGAFPLPSPD